MQRIMLICPKCKRALHKINNSYKCINNHTYDISKEGYINLLLSKTNAGDNKNLIDARIKFLSKDYYKPLATRLIEIMNKLNTTSLLDAGCGSGYYTKFFSESINQVCGVDISKEAIKFAAKKNKKALYVVSSNQSIPFNDKSFDTIVNIFAPYFENEFNRLLTDNGYLIIVHPNINHLWELKSLIYDNPYKNDHVYFNFKNLKIIDNQTLTYNININNEDLTSLFMMTPYYYKTKNVDFLKISSVSNLNLTIDFTISIFSKNKPEI